jgi:hypothetical protein
MLQGTVLAPEAREAVLKQPAGQEVAEFPLDKRRQAALSRLGRCGQERVEVVADDGMQDGVLGVAWLIPSRERAHAPA